MTPAPSGSENDGLTMMERVDDVLPVRTIGVASDCFICPFCGADWDRGGKKEGFVKAGAARHVAHCWELRLFVRGYMPGSNGKVYSIAHVISGKTGYGDRGPLVVKQLQASLRKAIRSGRMPDLSYASLNSVVTEPTS